MSAAKLAVEHICWASSASQPLILHPTSFYVTAGQVMGVVGANGAGKTTLLRMIYRHARPLSGSISVDGEDIWSLSPRHCARKIAAVLQEQPTDFALTVRDVVALGRIPHQHGFSAPGQHCAAVIDSVLQRMHLSDVVHRAFGTLSGGERQRVMVARALAQEPDILVLDEPTNHLDIRHQLEVLELIQHLDMTIIASLHDLNMAARVCDCIMMLHKGHPVGFGSPAEVLTSAHVSSAFDVQAELEQLSISQQQHLTFTLPHSNTGKTL